MRRSNRRRTRGAPRRPTEWIAFHLDDFDGLDGTQVQNYALVDDQEMVDADFGLTVERVVGQVLIMLPKDIAGTLMDEVLCRWWMGIIVLQLDAAGSALTMDPDGGPTGVDLEAQWLWMRQGFFAPYHRKTQLASTDPFLVTDPVWIDIDVHVRRKLVERQVLGLAIGIGSGIGQAPASASAILRMRTLVKHKG